MRAFRERLEAAGAERPLLLFLDSLDQLAVSYGAHGLSWLPTELPEGVWLVASTRPDEDDEAPRDAGSDRPVAARGQPATLQRLLPESAIIELGPMTLGEAEELLTKWLSGVRRELTGVQRSTVIDSFARYDPSGHRGLPLHLRLAFETARTWCSYNEPTGIRDRVREMVAALYERLEREHGPVLVGHTLAYLAATRNTMGLAEDEILDLFSAEPDTESEPRQGDAVLREFNERTKPEHRPPDGSLPPRLPVVVWSRLFFDLQPYLSTRSSEGASLLAFYHRELGEVATKRYLDGHRQDRHTVLAAMFRSMGDPRGDGTWAGRPRALAELPYHLTGAKRWDDAFEVLTDFTFLEEKAQRVGVVERPGSDEGTLYTGVYALLDDYETALAEFPSE